MRDAWTGICNLLFLNKKSDLDFSSSFHTPHYRLTNVARTGLGMILDIVQPDKSKKIALPAFTCAVVATPFLTAGYDIEWIDTDSNGMMDVEDFEKKVSKVGMVVVPHIFGQRAEIGKIFRIAKQHGVFVIKDAAHLFDTDTTDCDALIVSFGREKVFSCVSGGAVLWPSGSPYASAFASYTLPRPAWHWTVRHVLQPFWFSVYLPTWSWGGKYDLWLLRKMRILPLAVTQAKKEGNEDMPKCSLSYPMQKVLMGQLERREFIEVYRRELAQAWKKTLAQIFPHAKIIIPENCMRVILRTDQAEEIRRRALKINFDLRDWDGQPIAPASVNLKKFHYVPGRCPNAEDYAREYVTFPTNIRTRLQDIERFEKLYQA